MTVRSKGQTGLDADRSPLRLVTRSGLGGTAYSITSSARVTQMREHEELDWRNLKCLGFTTPLLARLHWGHTPPIRVRL